MRDVSPSLHQQTRIHKRRCMITAENKQQDGQKTQPACSSTIILRTCLLMSQLLLSCSCAGKLLQHARQLLTRAIGHRLWQHRHLHRQPELHSCRM
jgi:hypothetical protein